MYSIEGLIWLANSSFKMAVLLSLENQYIIVGNKCATFQDCASARSTSAEKTFFYSFLLSGIFRSISRNDKKKREKKKPEIKIPTFIATSRKQETGRTREKFVSHKFMAHSADCVVTQILEWITEYGLQYFRQQCNRNGFKVKGLIIRAQERAGLKKCFYQSNI